MDEIRRALLLEDDEVVREQIRSSLTAEGLEVSGCGSLDEAMASLAQAAPHIAVVDRGLPDGEGLRFVERLRQAGIEAPVLVLSALGQTRHRVEGLDAGADDYLPKPFEEIELRARVRSLLRRHDSRSQPRVRVLGPLEIHLSAREAHLGGQALKLRPKAFDLLLYLAENEGQIVTRAMLLQHVWNLSFDPQTNVVDVTIGRLRKILEAAGYQGLLETVRGEGYRLNAVGA
ncbi:MAG: response regulator transcription factor [Parvularcula sp.]|jgi:two-component system OmpR family response regulator|nr:response regulator transcription factor [Parvularcula sp.]